MCHNKLECLSLTVMSTLSILMKLLTAFHSKGEGRLLALPTNVSPRCKWQAVTNTGTYIGRELMKSVKSFIEQVILWFLTMSWASILGTGLTIKGLSSAKF